MFSRTHVHYVCNVHLHDFFGNEEIAKRIKRKKQRKLNSRFIYIFTLAKRGEQRGKTVKLHGAVKCEQMASLEWKKTTQNDYNVFALA